MKRVIIICEGPTEMEFCKNVLYAHFQGREIYIQTPLIKKSGGGIIPWPGLQRQIENHLLQDNEAIVTTLIDYYGIQDRHLFPRWAESKAIVDKNERMSFLEANMRAAIPQALNYRFFPYIQLHEFEGLLFNNIASFDNLIPAPDFVGRAELLQTLARFPNPEMINDTPQNTPYNRLFRIVKGYSKVLDGAKIGKEIGLDRIRSKCPRFNSWIILLEA